MIKVRVENDGYSGKKTVVTYTTETPDDVAQFAMQLIDRHANVAGHEDGEDSQGRSKLRLQTPEELVERSFKIAQLTFAMARARGHMLTLPDLNELNAKYDAAQEEDALKTLESRRHMRA